MKPLLTNHRRRSLAAAALCSAAALASCKGSGLAQSTAALLVTGTASQANQVSQSADKKRVTLDFGEVPVGATATLLLSFTSDNVPVQINSTNPVQGDAEFQLPIPSSTNVSLSAPVAVTATFSPTSGGSKQAVYVVNSDSQVNDPLTVTLKGTAVPFALTASPNPVDFGPVLINQSPSITVTFTNSSALPQPLVLGAAQAGAASNPANLFTVHPPSSAIVPPNGTATVQIDYGPVVGQNPPAADTATVGVANCAATCIGLTLNLRGVALETALTVTPDPLRFGFLAIDRQGTQTLQIHNSSTATVTLRAPGLDGGSFSPTPFALGALPSFPTVLAPDAGVSFSLTFKPQQIGEFNGALVVNSDDPLTPQGLSVPLIGYGGGAQLACLPTALPFGPWAIGATETQVLTCTNIGTDVPGHPEAALSLSTPTLTGDPAFTAGAVSDAGLAAGQSAFLAVSFSPVDAGLRQGALTVLSNALQNPPPLIPLSGVGIVPSPCDVAIQPAQVGFGEVPKGASATESFVVENLANSYCLLQNLGLRQGGDPAFSLPQGALASQLLSFPGDPNNADGVVPIDLQVPVAFTPSTAEVAANGNVDFTLAQTVNGARSVPLSATSAAACITVTPDPLDFAVVGYDAADKAACSYGTKTVTVTNTCATTQSLTAIAVTPDPAGGPPAFAAQSPRLPAVLPPGQSTTFDVSFTPLALGPSTGTVEISTTALTAPYTLAVQGRAATSGSRTDTYLVPKLQADILMVMDISAPSAEFLNQVALGPLKQLVAYANAAAIDYHFGLTTSSICQSSDDGNLEPCAQCLVNTVQKAIIVSPSSLPDPATLLNDLWLGVLANVPAFNACGSNGTALDAVNLALQPAILTGQNAGFLRAAAQLLVLVIDATDPNYGSNLSDSYPQDIHRLLQLKPRGRVSLVYVGLGLAIDGADARSTKIRAAIDLLGKGSEVDGAASFDWPAKLVSSFAQDLGSGVFALGSAPASSSLQVTVNNTAVPALGDKGPNWFYDSSTHSVVFQQAALPQPGQTVAVSYQLACGPVPDGGSPVPDAGQPQCNQPGGLPAFSQCVLNVDCACGLECVPDTVNFTTASFCERPCLIGDAGCPPYETCNATTGACQALCNPTANNNEFQSCSAPGDCACPLQCVTDPVQNAPLCERGCSVNADCIGINESCSADAGHFCERTELCNPVSGQSEFYQPCVSNSDCACPLICVDDPFIPPITGSLGNTCEKGCRSNADCTEPWQTCNLEVGACQTLDHCIYTANQGPLSTFGPCQDGVPGGQCQCGLTCTLDPNLSRSDAGLHFCEFCDGGNCQTPSGNCHLADAGLPPTPEVLNGGCNSDVDCNCPEACVFDPGLGGTACRATCSSDADCLDPTTICNTQTGTCNLQACNIFSGNNSFRECGTGTCANGACFAPGTATVACDPAATRATPAKLCAQGRQCVPQPDGGGLCLVPCDNNLYSPSGCNGTDVCHYNQANSTQINNAPPASCLPIDSPHGGCSPTLPPPYAVGESGLCPNGNSDCLCPGLCTGFDDLNQAICQRGCTTNTDCPDPLTACVGNVCALQKCSPVGSYCQAGDALQDGTCVAFDHFAGGGAPVLVSRGGVCERGGTATTVCGPKLSGTDPATLCTPGHDCFPTDAGLACLPVCGYDGGCASPKQCALVANARQDPELACLTLSPTGCDPVRPRNELENCNTAADCACGLDCVDSQDNSTGLYQTSRFCELPCASSADCSNVEVCVGPPPPGLSHCALPPRAVFAGCFGSVGGQPSFSSPGGLCSLDATNDGTCLEVLPAAVALPAGPNATLSPPYCVKGGTAKGACNPAATRQDLAALCLPLSACLTVGGVSTCSPYCDIQLNRPDGTNPGCGPAQYCDKQNCYPPTGVP